jgi:hypothetical protein
MAGVQPIDQASGLANGMALVPNYVDQGLARQLAQARIGGLQAQTNYQNAEANTQAAALDDDQRYQAAVHDYLLRPTPQGAHDLVVQFPKKAEAVKQGWTVLDNQQRQTNLTQMGSVLSLATAGKFDKAAATMRQRIEADTAAGQDTKDDQAILEALESPDPTERNLAVGLIQYHVAAIAGPEHFGSALESLQKGKEGFTLGAGQKRFDNSGNVIAEVAPETEYLVIPEGGKAVPKGSLAGGGGQASGETGAASSSPSGAPRSVRNNNPGNLRVSGFTRSQPGFKGADSAGYAIFDSPESGTKAQAALLAGKGYYGGGRRTPRAIIEKWAPRASKGGDNTDAQVDNYIGYAAQQLGIGPDDTIPSERLPALAAAMSRFESGATGAAGQTRVPQGATAHQTNDPAGTLYGAPRARPARMTPEEVRAEGLDPGTVYYRDAAGIPQAVTGQSGKTSALTEGQAKAVGFLSTAVASVNALNSIDGHSYKPSEVAYGLNTLSAGNPVKRNLSQVERRVLNAQMAFAGALLRLESGAVVSDQEIARKAQTLFPMPGDGSQVQADKKAQRDAGLAALRAAAGPGSEKVKPALPPGGAVRVRSRQEAMSLKPGTLYIRPDGKVMRR